MLKAGTLAVVLSADSWCVELPELQATMATMAAINGSFTALDLFILQTGLVFKVMEIGSTCLKGFL
jgi:hypothetical protein